MTFFGLPLHPLVVHATVVFVPLAAIALIAVAISPRLRERLGIVPAALAVVAFVLTPISTFTGENLEEAIGDPLFDHADYGEMLWWLTLPMALLAVAAHVLGRRGSGLARLLGVVAAVVGLGAIALVGVIGHTGASSAWCGRSPDFTQCPAAEQD